MFIKHGHCPTIHILDNEFSKDIKQYLKEEEIWYQLVPPYVHRRNASERSIQTWKGNFISGLEICDPNYPALQWDRLVQKSNTSLNLLRSSRTHPQLSAYTSVIGPFDFNSTPMAPPGTNIMIHDTPSQRKTVASHGTDAWYVGPAMHHYRCFRCYLPKPNSERTELTVEWFPHKISIPQPTVRDYIKQLTQDLTTLLVTKTKSQFMELQYVPKLLNSFHQVADIFKRATVT